MRREVSLTLAPLQPNLRFYRNGQAVSEGSDHVSIATASIPETLNRLQGDLALSDEELAGVLALSPVQLERVRAGRYRLPDESDERLEQLIALNDRLQDSFQPDGVIDWLRYGLRYAHGETGLALLTAGRFDRFTAALDAFDAGVFL